MSIMGELLAQVANQGVDVWHAGPVAAFVEEEVVRWLCDLVGYGEGAFGLLTSGGVMANFIAMALARDVHLGRLRGLSAPPRGRDLEGARVYTSDQTHFSIARALDELGFPPETLVVLPADDDFRLRGAPVAEAIARDRAAGLTPFAIAAVAGSTNTGSVDAIGELADVAEARGPVAPRRRGLRRRRPAVRARRATACRTSTAPTRSRSTRTSGSSRPTTSAGCSSATAHARRRVRRPRAGVLPRRRDRCRRRRPTPARRRATTTTATSSTSTSSAFEGTRRWRALKLWMTWKHLGTTGFGRLIEANDDLAAYLAAAAPRPTTSRRCRPSRSCPSSASATCRPALAAATALDAHQDRLQAALEASGDGWLTTTRLRGATWLRAGIVNYLTTEADIDRLLETLRRLAG